MPKPGTSQPSLTLHTERSQLDFELKFLGEVLERLPNYTDAIRVHATNLFTKGQLKECLLLEQRMVELRPHDPDARYSLACRYAMLHQSDLAIETLRQALELGFTDLRSMIQEKQLESVRRDPRFRELLKRQTV
jgi:tetratricopeptide (TPR) repeat protein